MMGQIPEPSAIGSFVLQPGIALQRGAEKKAGSAAALLGAGFGKEC